ncbi:MAG: CBS domain-containing protein [Ignavibacteria bacterium]
MKEIKYKITIDKTLYDAFNLMIENQLAELPVLSKSDDKFLGILKIEGIFEFLKSREEEITKEVFI